MGPGTKFGLLSKELFFFLINLTLSRDEVDLGEGDDFGFEVELVTRPEDEERGNSDVGCDECVGFEGNEGVVTFEKGDDSRGDKGKV